MESEQIVFVDESGRPTGKVGPELASHTASTKLHLGFSCYIFRRSDNKFLATQRSMAKKVWPGLWTNSVCGHPAPGETVQDAIGRRAHYELGLTDLQDIEVVLPDYRYTTPPYKGIIENEFCPVYLAYTNTQDPTPNPDEVAAYEWLDWFTYVYMLQEKPGDMTYWARDQYTQLKHKEPFASLVKPLTA